MNPHRPHPQREYCPHSVPHPPNPINQEIPLPPLVKPDPLCVLTGDLYYYYIDGPRVAAAPMQPPWSYSGGHLPVAPL